MMDSAVHKNLNYGKVLKEFRVMVKFKEKCAEL